MVEIEIGGMELENLELSTLYFLIASLVVYFVMKQMVTGVLFWLLIAITEIILLPICYFWCNYQVNKG